MPKQVIFTGTAANDGTGSNLRSGGIIINNNFNEIYSAIGDGTNLKGYITIEDTSSTQNQVNIGEKLQFIGANGITTSVGNNEIQIAIDGTVLTETSTDTLLNKSINLNVNTITGTTADFNTALSDDDFATIAGTETFTNKTLTSPIINSPTGDVVTLTGAQTITDKTLTSPIINTPTGDVATKDGTQTLTNKTIDTGSNSITGSLFNVADDSSTTSSIAQGDVLKISGGDGISTTTGGDTITVTATGITKDELSASAGILNTQLANNSLILGYTSVELGTSSTLVNGLSITGSSYMTISGQGSAIRFNHPNFASFPNYTTYSGSPALDNATNKVYMASSGGWMELITENSSIAKISDVNIAGIGNGDVIAWNATTTRFEPAASSGTPVLSIADDSSTVDTIALGSQVLQFFGGTGINTVIDTAADSVTISSIGPVPGTNYNHDYAGINDLGYIGYRSPDNTISKTLTITVAAKASDHYYFGDGAASGFSIDGKPSPALSLSPGKYKFDQAESSNTGHTLKFYRDAAKTVPYTIGITHTGTPGSAGAFSEIELNSDTPERLYYQSQGGAYMGHVIDVVGGRSEVSTSKLVGDGSTSTFTINNGRTVDDILVFVNGICLVPTDDYQVSSTNLSFTLTPAIAAEIVVRYIS